MKTKNEVITHDCAIVVGRFQVHELHQAHKDLIQTVIDRHSKVILFLGLSHTKGTKNNPLDFETRKQMILNDFPGIIVAYIADCRDDETWSRKLDEQISLLIGANQSAVLYGGRDSFISHYTGNYETIELLPDSVVSGTELRKTISKKVMNDPAFRAGAIWLSAQSYDQVYATVDIAILNEDETKVLLARKQNEDRYRFIGGFASTSSMYFEEDAKREVSEETGLEVSMPKYIGSTVIDDWRYRSEASKIKTLIFVCKLIFGTPKANDDICEVRWFNIKELTHHDLVGEHGVALYKFHAYLKKEKNQTKKQAGGINV